MDMTLMTKAAHECMSPDEMNAFEALFVDTDLFRRYVNCVRKRLAPSDAAQAPLPTRYFVQDNDGGYEEFNTDEERDKAHRAAIEGYMDDGWSEEVESVVSGIVTHRTVQTDVEHRPPRCTEHPEQDNDACDTCVAWGEFPNHDFDMCCRYEPEQIAASVAPAAAAPSVPEGWKLVPVEPTHEMEAAAQRLPHQASKRNIYQAMLGACASPAPLAAAELTDDLLREAFEFTCYVAAAFCSDKQRHRDVDGNVYCIQPTTEDWWDGLREDLEMLQPKLKALLSTPHGDKQ